MTATIGKPIDRVDGSLKTTGQARFAAEFPYDGLAHAALTCATITRGRITSIDITEACTVPGTVTVLTHLNAPRMHPPPKPSPLNLDSLASGTRVNCLNTDEIHWNGQPIAIAVAETLEAAQLAAELVHVTCEPLPFVVDFAAELAHAVPQKGSALQHASGKKGDADAALASAPVSVDLRFTTPRHHHNAMEPHATTAIWDGEHLTIHDSTQNVHWVRSHVALRLGLSIDDVRVISPFVGGAFGGKSNVWPSTVLAALAARVTRRPVRLALSREGVYRATGGRHPSVQRVALGAERDGRLTALIHESTAPLGRAGGAPEQVTSVARHVYGAEHIRHQQNVLELDTAPNSIFRAPGESIGSYALECAVDELAYQLGMDPIELRLRNEPATNPIDGKAFSHRGLRQCFHRGAEKFGWSARTPAPGSISDGRWLVGWGTATAYHPAWQFTANVSVRLSVDGTVLVRCGFHEMGMGAATVQGQIAADTLGVPLEAVKVEYGDTELPAGPGAGGSAQTASVARSVVAACEKLKKAIGKPRVGESYMQVLARTGREYAEATIGSDSRIGKIASQAKFTAKFLKDQAKWVKAACGAHFCEVRVDPDTGEMRVARWTGVFDVGRVINAKTTASQLRGGIVMGIGLALLEETLLDPRSGRIMNPSLSEYHVPVNADVPHIDVDYLGDPDPTMPLGILGAGEVGICGAAAAIANAVYHATGKRIYELPITLDKLWS